MVKESRYEVWMGTPNTMAKRHVSIDTIPKLRSTAIDALNKHRPYCELFDHTALDAIRQLTEELNAVTAQSFAATGTLRWEFPMANLPAVRIELRDVNP